MRQTAPGTARTIKQNPVSSGPPFSGATVRPAARTRGQIMPQIWPHPLPSGIAPDHEYVFTYWASVLGTRPLAELLRLMTAAQRQTALPIPVYLAALAREQLVQFGPPKSNAQGYAPQVWVHRNFPPLGPQQIARLKYGLRQRHSADLISALGPGGLTSPHGQPGTLGPDPASRHPA